MRYSREDFACGFPPNAKLRGVHAMKIIAFAFCGAFSAIAFGSSALAGAPGDFKCSFSGSWKIEASAAGIKGSFEIEPAATVKVDGERVQKLPLFNPKAWGGWQKGYAFKGVKAQECAVKGAIDPLSVKVADAANPSTVFVKGKDYELEGDWGAVGRLADGSIGESQAVDVSYEYATQRIDTLALSPDGKSFVLRKGAPDVCLPKPPALKDGETALLNVYVPGRQEKLSDENLYPISETAFPVELAASAAGSAEKLLPKTMKKLRDGERIKILAWGDSVTDGGFLPEKERNRWQAQFVSRLKAKYPNAEIELATEAWGGHNTTQYLAEPPGAVHNYKEKVLAAKPDLIVMEFVNDAGLKKEVVDERYAKFLAEFKDIGAEWIILTPHYIRPDWMGLKTQKGIDEDPRQYVAAVRDFCARNDIAIADASQRYGRLWRQGVPYLTLMSNNINHPEPRGMAIFADALMNLFP